MVREQARKGEVWVLTGSPTLFVDPIREFVPEISRVVGVEQNQIITYSTGKIRRILSIIPVEQIQGFTGETWTNDDPLLSYLRNIRGECVDLRFINHGQTDTNTKKNLCRYSIRCVNVGKY